MPTIELLFDDTVVKDEEIAALGAALKEISLGAENLHDVSFAFAYGTKPKIKVGLDPIEAYIKISRWKIYDEKKLLKELCDKLRAWKKENNFPHPVNLLLIPMDWIFENGV